MNEPGRHRLFPPNEAERQAAADPRRSLAARYGGRTDYESKLRAAAAGMVGQRYLLAEEVDTLVSEAGSLYDRILAREPLIRAAATCSAPRYPLPPAGDRGCDIDVFLCLPISTDIGGIPATMGTSLPFIQSPEFDFSCPRA